MLAQLSFQMAQTQVQRLSEARQDPGPAGQIKASPVHAGCDTDSPQDRLSARFLHLASWFLGQLFIMTDFQPVAIVSVQPLWAATPFSAHTDMLPGHGNTGAPAAKLCNFPCTQPTPGPQDDLEGPAQASAEHTLAQQSRPILHNSTLLSNGPLLLAPPSHTSFPSSAEAGAKTEAGRPWVPHPACSRGASAVGFMGRAGAHAHHTLFPDGTDHVPHTRTLE